MTRLHHPFTSRHFTSWIALVCALLVSGRTAGAQVNLSGTSYTENFANIGSGLPTGWSVHTSATINTLGTSASFSSSTTAWNAATAGSDFRNVSGSNIVSGSSSGTQASNSDRAFGWRPLSAATREGAVMLTFANTTGFTNFNLSLSLFTGNDVTGSQSYAIEYRIGDSGGFTQLGSTYATGTPFAESTFSFGPSELSAWIDQSSPVYLRIRGLSTTGSGNLDTVVLDNVQLTFAPTAIPEPSSWAIAAAGAAFLIAFAGKRKARRNLHVAGATTKD